jgi:hypothetical protein
MTDYFNRKSAACIVLIQCRCVGVVRIFLPKIPSIIEMNTLADSDIVPSRDRMLQDS